MFGALVNKELKSIILSPKFSVTFAVCSALILLSIFTGIHEYNSAVKGWDSAVSLANQQAGESTNWRQFSYKTQRKPDPMSIFVSGLSNDIGRWSNISTDESVKLEHSPYSDDPIYAVFRMVDFSFVVLIALSLFAILFTYDAINGERESGTLKLVLANSVPRAKYLLAKLTGAWLGLALPILVTILLGLLMVIAYGIPLTTVHWMKLVTMIGVSILFFTLFITIGALFSTLTRHSNVSFLLALIFWVAIVLILPRAGVMAAGSLVDVPRVAEIEGQRDGYAKNLWAKFYKDMEVRFQEDESTGHEPDDDIAMWARMEREDSLRKEIERDVEEYETKLLDDLRRKKAIQERLAFTLSRFSPASAFQLAMMRLGGTDITLKSRYQESMTSYREQWSEYVNGKREESGDHGGFMSIEISSEDGVKIGTGRNDQVLDVSDMPRYEAPEQSFSEVINPILADISILSLGILLSFLGSFVAFLRYDVR